ncbi:glycoside hydrolase family 31 [Kipferlia bialata]|uniref:Glycoside hydrolase family 31 n=1 Tax=Kipferlia bialata TaxID=797122 RepID=A0A9K3CSM8_9EUKA|nr:glycoside hydrolase family 31 [Kipferlia bialata]|eukprot:g3598.t1
MPVGCDGSAHGTENPGLDRDSNRLIGDDDELLSPPSDTCTKDGNTVLCCHIQSKALRVVLRVVIGIVVVPLLVVVALALTIMLCFYRFPLNMVDSDVANPHTPVWALLPIVWEDDTNTVSTPSLPLSLSPSLPLSLSIPLNFTLSFSRCACVTELVQDFLDCDYPVGTVLIDSPWATAYNDFTPAETYTDETGTVVEGPYPDWNAFIAHLRKTLGVHVMLWMTTMVNSYSKKVPDTDSSAWAAESDAYTCGGDFHWWLGEGRSVDYSSSAAMEWWQGMQEDLVLRGDSSIDGWKLDGTGVLFCNNLRHA